MSYYTILFVFLIYSDIQQSHLPSFLRPTSILIFLSRYLTQRLKNLTCFLLHSLICHFLNQIIEFSQIWSRFNLLSQNWKFNQFSLTSSLCLKQLYFFPTFVCVYVNVYVCMWMCICVHVSLFACVSVHVTLYVCMYVCVRKSLFASDLYFSNAHTLWESERYYDNI